MSLAIAHLAPDGQPVLDAVNTSTVAGGDAGIDEVYRGLRAEGIEVDDERAHAVDREVGDVRQRAIAGALKKVVEQ
jgi:hypothetical protein